METHPPTLIENIVGKLIPPACREHVLGDLHERYSSPAQYVLDAARTAPFVVASQARRRFSMQLLVSEACAIYLAFDAVLSSGLVNGSAALLSILILIMGALFALVICDAYADPHNSSWRNNGFHAAIALCCGYLAQTAAGWARPDMRLANAVVLFGAALSILMLIQVRTVFQHSTHTTASPGRDANSLEALRLRAEAEARKAWFGNWIWLTGGVILLLGAPKASSGEGPGRLILSVALLAVVGMQFRRAMRGEIGGQQRTTTLAIARDAYRDELQRKREGLVFWAGGSATPVLLLVLIGFPLLMPILRWAAGAPYPPSVTPTRLWLTFAAFGLLAASWAFVRRFNLRAARAIGEELDALDSAERKR